METALSPVTSAPPARLRVLVAHSFYRLPGGEDRYVEQQVPLLRRRHDARLLERHNRELTPAGRTAVRMTYSKREARAVEEAIEAFQPHVVHLHNAYPALGPAVHLACDRRGVPLVVTVHNFRLRCPNGYMFTEGAPCMRCARGAYHNAVLHDCFASRSQALAYASTLWTHRFVLRLERKVALFLCPSEFVRRRMLEWGFAPERVAVVRNFTALEGAGGEPGDAGLYLGRLSAEKGVDVLLHALARAGDPPFRIAGDGPTFNALGDLARRLELRRVEFLGHVDEPTVAELLRDARYLAVPSLWDENAPIAALEAMSAGRPLVVADVGGLPELVRNGEGLTFPAGDPGALAARIRLLAEDAAAWRSAAERALTRARAEFTPEHHLGRLEAAYASVLSGRAPTPG